MTCREGGTLKAERADRANECEWKRVGGFGGQFTGMGDVGRWISQFHEVIFEGE